MSMVNLKPPPLSKQESSVRATKSILHQHLSFKGKKNYTVVNELSPSSYFGEISVLTNLPVTASIHTVSDVV
jgi:CRP-like cAMP-binding protein